MKQRIQSRVQIARKLLKERNRFDRDEHGLASIDLMLHLIADGNTVKVYHDTQHGGTVVELPDE